jgi:hypothetical protein
VSSYKSLNLFGSGPHRFHAGPRGHLLTQDFFFGGSGGGSTAQGLISYEIVVTGRLVAASESALWALRDAVIAQLQAVPTGGTLIDNLGRSWTGMSFVTYTEQPRTDRGRTRSIGYTAVFKKL